MTLMQHNNIYRALLCLGIAAAAVCPSAVQAQDSDVRKAHVSGSIQSDVLIPQSDEKIGAEKPSEWGLTNTFAEVNMASEYVDALLPGWSILTIRCPDSNPTTRGGVCPTDI